MLPTITENSGLTIFDVTALRGYFTIYTGQVTHDELYYGTLDTEVLKEMCFAQKRLYNRFHDVPLPLKAGQHKKAQCG